MKAYVDEKELDLEPAFIIGRGLAHWANQPPIGTEAEREVAAVEYRIMLDFICKSWGLKIVRID